MKNVYKILDKEFTSQENATNFVRNYLKQNGIGKVVIDSYLHKILTYLINLHPEKIIKIGIGIDYFSVEKNKINTKALEVYIHRTDSTYIDFSWIKCISNNFNYGTRKNLKSAMRLAIQSQIYDFKFEHRNDLCGICNNPIYTDKHVDHIEPFDTLVNFFLETTPYTIPVAFDDDSNTNSAKFKLQDEVFETCWRITHKLYAKLRITHSKCNLTRKRK